MLFLSYTAFILMWFNISIFIFLKFILGVANDVTSGSANSFIISGKYFLRASVTDTPYHSYAESLLEVFAGSSINYYIIQRISSYGGFQDFYIRCSLNNGQSWSDWVGFVGNMPTFYKDYSTLASLASALGGLYKISVINSGDVNDLGSGIYGVNGQLTNAPANTGASMLIIMEVGWIRCDVILDRETAKLFYRFKWGSAGFEECKLIR